MKKFISVFLCIVTITALFTCCKGNEAVTEESETTVQQETTEAVKADRKISLGYFEDKGLNPYKTESPLNRNLLTLVYDGLYLAQDGYTVSPLIASASEKDGKKLTVTINEEMYFSDGSVIDAADVVYSFNLAKENSYYKKRLSGFASATASASTVIFTLEKEDIFAENCLTFPVIKHGTGNDKTPVGSGRYTVKSKNGEYYLKANDNTTRKEEMTTKNIRLVPVSAQEGELYLLQTGDLTYFFDDLSDGEYTKIGADMVKMPLNNLVFITLNREKEIFSDENIVQAVNLCVDRTGICDSVYEGMYRKPKSAFNPDWQAVASLSESENPYDTQQAEKLLEESGYIYAYSHNAYRSKNFVFIEMTLLVCSDNPQKVTIAKEIKKSLEGIGIKILLEEKPYDEYIDCLEKGDFDIYIGEIKLSANMSLSPFFKEGGSASYGIDTDSIAATAYFDFAKGAIDISTFVQVFGDALPFIPLCYRDGMAYYSRELSYEGTVNEYEPFKNIYSWEV